MGLDAVELIIGIEDAFHIAIPDTAAVRIRTPRQLVEYLSTRLGTGTADCCLTQRAFYRLRGAATRVFELPRAAIAVDTSWCDLLPTHDRGHSWSLLQRDIGSPAWPRLTLWGAFPADVSTVGGMARYLAERSPASLKGLDEPWHPKEIEKIVAHVLDDTLGITHFEWNDDFINDLGLN